MSIQRYKGLRGTPTQLGQEVKLSSTSGSMGNPPEPFLSECRNTAHRVFNFCICKNWTLGKVQELVGAKCNVMQSEV